MSKCELDWKRDTRGISLVEILVALLIFSVAIIGLSSVGLVSTRTLRAGDSYARASIAAQSKLDSLRSAGWAALTDGLTGSDNVQGYAVSWSVAGTDPRRVTLVVARSVMGMIYPDTFVTYVAQGGF